MTGGGLDGRQLHAQVAIMIRSAASWRIAPPEDASQEASIDLRQPTPNHCVNVVELTNAHYLSALRAKTEVTIAMIDGPVDSSHPELASAIKGSARALPRSFATQHGTYIAGILVGRAGGHVPGLAPTANLIVESVFHGGHAVTVGTDEIAAAIERVVAAGASVVNISAAWSPRAAPREIRAFSRAIDLARQAGAILVTPPPERHWWVDDLEPLTDCVIFAKTKQIGRMPNPCLHGGQSPAIRTIYLPRKVVAGLGPRFTGGLAQMSGDSVSTAALSGVIARLLGVFPGIHIHRLFEKNIGGDRQLGLPVLDADRLALSVLKQLANLQGASPWQGNRWEPRSGLMAKEGGLLAHGRRFTRSEH